GNLRRKQLHVKRVSPHVAPNVPISETTSVSSSADCMGSVEAAATGAADDRLFDFVDLVVGHALVDVAPVGQSRVAGTPLLGRRCGDIESDDLDQQLLVLVELLPQQV